MYRKHSALPSCALMQPIVLSLSARNVSISVPRQRNVHRFGREACVTPAGIWADTLNWWASGAYDICFVADWQSPIKPGLCNPAKSRLKKEK